MAVDSATIVVQVTQDNFKWSLANNAPLQNVLQNFSGQIAYHLPSHKLLQLANLTSFTLQPKTSQVSVHRPTVFTDGSGKTGNTIVTWKEGSEWQVLKGHKSGSAQQAELKAVAMAFQRFSQVPLNLVTDSAFVVDIIKCLDCSLLKEVNNAALFSLLQTLWNAIQARLRLYYILHIQSHTTLPGFITEGNARTDMLANPVWIAPQPDKIAQAK
ncbi:POK18 protein, partial [Grantiella picta]|nr:POK18 protein [Grantiella picta]